MTKKTLKIAVALLLISLLINCYVAIAYADNGGIIVYVTDTGSKYHRYGCSYLKSINSISLLNATIEGYSPCSRCNPPIFDGVLPEATKPRREGHSGSSGGSGSNWADQRETPSPAATGSTKATEPSDIEVVASSAEQISSVQDDESVDVLWIISIVYISIWAIPAIWKTISLIVRETSYFISDVAAKRKAKKLMYAEARNKMAIGLQVATAKACVLFSDRENKIAMLHSKRSTIERMLASLLTAHGARLSPEGNIMIVDPKSYRADVFILPSSNTYHTACCPCINDKKYRCRNFDLIVSEKPNHLSPCQRCRPQDAYAWVSYVKRLQVELFRISEHISLLENAELPDRLTKLNERFRNIPDPFAKKPRKSRKEKAFEKLLDEYYKKAAEKTSTKRWKPNIKVTSIVLAVWITFGVITFCIASCSMNRHSEAAGGTKTGVAEYRAETVATSSISALTVESVILVPLNNTYHLDPECEFIPLMAKRIETELTLLQTIGYNRCPFCTPEP